MVGFKITFDKLTTQTYRTFRYIAFKIKEISKEITQKKFNPEIVLNWFSVARIFSEIFKTKKPFVRVTTTIKRQHIHTPTETHTGASIHKTKASKKRRKIKSKAYQQSDHKIGGNLRGENKTNNRQ